MKLYLEAFLLSVSLHAFLLILLIFSPAQHSKHYVMKKEKHPTDIIKSVSIDEVRVDNEVKRLQKERIQKKQAELDHQKRLHQRAKRLKKQRIAEQKKIKELKQKAKNLALANKKQAQEQALKLQREEKRLAELKEKRKLALVKVKKEKEAYTALKKKRIKEQREKEKEIEQAKQRQEQKQLDKKRLAELKKSLHQEALREAKIQKMAGIVNQYKALIINAISQHWIVPPEANKDVSCRFEIHLADNGVVLSVRLLRSSGDPVLDRSARTAIYKASPLPVPKTPDAFALFKVVSLTVKPEGLLS